VTKFHLVKRFQKQTPNGESFSLVKAHPLTGRTHQIRVHLASLGHPIVGDKIYGPDENLYLRFIDTGWTDELARRLLLERHALHASRLRIDDERDWSSSLPEDCAAGCRCSRGRRPRLDSQTSVLKTSLMNWRGDSAPIANHTVFLS